MRTLIYKFLSNSITSNELDELEDWLRDSEENKNIFNAYIRDSYTSNILNNSIDTEKAYNKVLENLANKTKVIPFYKKNYIKYAAVFLALLSISILFITNNNTSNNTPVIVNNTIKTGTDKATLTLEDGSNITLEKGKEYSNNTVKSSGDKIAYSKNSSTKKSTSYNYLTIPRGGQYQVVLADGTKIWLNSESKLKYPINFTKGETRSVELVYGEAYFDVSPSTKHNGDKFKVLTKNQEIEVLGTEFNVKAYTNEVAIYTTLAEGKIALNNTKNKKTLIPGEQAINTLNNNNIVIKNIDVYREISWKDGIYSFKGKTLKEIMTILSRWYNIEVVFENKDLESVKFIGVLSRQQSIEEIMSAIKSSTINNYEINNNKIIIK